MSEQTPVVFQVTADAAGKRLDQFLAAQLPEISRARVQQLISQGKVHVNESEAKPSLRLRGGEHIAILGPAQVPPLRACQRIFLWT